MIYYPIDVNCLMLEYLPSTVSSRSDIINRDRFVSFNMCHFYFFLPVKIIFVVSDIYYNFYIFLIVHQLFPDSNVE